MFPFKRPARASSHAVLSPCQGGAAALRLEGDPSQPRVAAFAVADNPALTPDLLGRLAHEAGIQHEPLTALLDHEAYQTVLIEAPNVPDDELPSALRWKVKDLINFHIDDAVLDHLPVPGRAGQPPSLYVVAAQAPAVRDLARPYQQADLPLAAIDIREAAQRNLSVRLAPEDYAVAVLHFDGESGLLTFTFGEDLVLSRRIEGRGAGGDFLFDRVAMEAQRSVDYFERQFSWLPLAKLYLAPMPDSALLVRKLAEYLPVGTEVLDLGRLFDLAGQERLLDERMQNRVFHLLGAALREAR
ncbi:MAG: agglutinin biogenesis protein MshI [Gammaproteobacteria bacterium]|nr:agglutinin biogenesis protein MshI [Gammaproteobacteria bacterium]